MWQTYVFALAAFGLFVLLLLGMHIGTRMALGHDSRTEEDIRRGTGAIEGALFALLGLLLAFMYSGSASRFSDRRELMVTEANAIGTAYLRIDLLPAESQPSLRQLFRDYTDARIHAFDLAPDSSAWAEFDRAQALQTPIWNEAVAAASKAVNPTTLALVLNPINDLIDITTTHEAALNAHTPMIFHLLMIGLALTCSILAGRTMASRRFDKRSYRLAFAVVFSLAFMVILDADYPRAGFITIERFDQALVKTRAAMR